ncbi:MAG: hypothetical protein KH309_09430 [Ruminococcus sp.]|nr:hypothetical protein [Ruminococcus sp.]
MCVTICGRFCPDEGAVAGYGNHAAYFTDQALEDMVHNSLIVTSQYFKTMKEQP